MRRGKRLLDDPIAFRRFSRTLDEVRRRSRPTARLVARPASPARSIAVVSGAFDPPTRAHEALARAALHRGAEAALFALGTVTLDKRESGLALEDRLALLVELAGADPRLGVVVHNAGLYADQAVAIRRAIPGLEDLAFVVGFDKLPRILDPRYYEDLALGLEQLLSSARLLVAPRGEDDRTAFERLRAAPAAALWRSRIEYLPLADRWRRTSATDVRAAITDGRDPGHALPRGWVARLDGLGVYDPARRARYRARVRRLRQSPSSARTARSAKFA